MLRHKLFVFLLLLFPLASGWAAVVNVRRREDLLAAIAASAAHLNVTASFSVCWTGTLDIGHSIEIHGNPGVVLDMCLAKEPLLNISQGSLLIRTITLGNFIHPSAPSGSGPVAQIVSSGGNVVFDEVVFYLSGRQGVPSQLSFWAEQLAPEKQLGLQATAQVTRALRLRDWFKQAKQGSVSVTNSILVPDVQHCYHSGKAVVFDTASFRVAAQYAGVDSMSIIQEFTVQCSVVQQAVGSRAIQISSCPAGAGTAQQMQACLGQLAYTTGHWLEGMLPARRLLSVQKQQPQQTLQPLTAGSMALKPSASRRLAHTEPAENTSSTNAPSPDPQLQARVQIHPGGLEHDPVTAASSFWLAPDRAALMAAKYPKDNCFQDNGGFSFKAKDANEFKRLLTDPAVTHIELWGDMIMTEELFPPELSNDRSKGVNITHRVEVRACTGDVNKLILVDINNLQQQIYVYGYMRWAGNIRFINSWPSPRRAGLFQMISLLSIEENGIIELEDVEIVGTETNPVFQPDNPFWYTYSSNPLSVLFVPQSDDFVRLSSNEVLLLDWMFNKSAWVRATQGVNGVSLAVGDGFWHFVDVMTSYTQQEGSAKSALQIVLPVVLGTIALLALGGGLWLWRRRQQHQARRPTITGVDVLTKDVSAFDVSSSDQQTSSSMRNPSDTLPSRQHLSTTESAKLDSSRPTETEELIEEVRRRMQVTARRDTNIQLEGLLGEGTFGKVYKGYWRGTVVAVKTMLFPAAMSGKEKREKMAIMETAISSSLSHPNIVQTYTYVVKPLTGELLLKALELSKGVHTPDGSDPSSAMHQATEPDSAESHGWEVRLVLELCDRGSLKDLLNNNGLRDPVTGKPDMPAIVATAMDVAKAMLHLHSENVIHSDLKARNVLMKSAGDDARGFVAKVSDFGLSVKIDPSETHVSNIHQGTLTHMAPELLMYGKASRASDVYAFGILLWELYTAQQAFKGIPRVLLGHEITKLGRRPEFPEDCPFEYQLLACRCWESDPGIRPAFQQILADLQRLASKYSVDIATSLSNGATATQHPAGPADGGIDPAKLHNWEPQTSLLDPNGISTEEGSCAPAGGPTPEQEGGTGNSTGVPSGFGWDSHSHGGFWLGGSLAPSDVPSDFQLPPHEPQAAAAVLTSSAGQQQFQANGGAAVSPAAVPNGSQQQHRTWCPDARMPEDLQPPQRHQQQRCKVDRSEGTSSSSGVYIQDPSSTMPDGCDCGLDQQQQQYKDRITGSTAAGEKEQGMAPIAEDENVEH